MHFTELDWRADLETERSAIADAEEARASVDSIAAIDVALDALGDVDEGERARLERFYGALFGELLRTRVEGSVTRDGRRALMAAFYTGTFAIFFAHDGTFLGHETYGPSELEDDPHPDRYGPNETHLREWQEQLGFEAATIEVEGFWVSEFGVGIEDMPGHDREFLDDPESEPDEEERKHRFADIRRWMETESFVLYWGNDLWLDGRGVVTSS